MDVLVSGRHCTISDDFREKAVDRIGSIERLRDRVIRVEVQVSAETHTSQPDQATTCEITLHSKGPVVRAEASAEDKYIAFDRALDKLKSQLRKAADRRKTHRGLRIGQQPSGSTAAPLLAPLPEEAEAPQQRTMAAGLEVVGDGPLVVREKYFPGAPLTLAQALDEMELVGHDFFLYVDAGTGHPSVVYRRRAYDYGVIHLEVAQ